MHEFITRKYFCLTFRCNIKAYVKNYNIYLSSKAVCHKLYGNFQSIPIPTYQWKKLSINFVIGLPISIDRKSKSYDSIFAIIYCLIKMIYYKSVKVIINIAELANVIMNVIVRRHILLELIIRDQDSLFTSKFWFLLYYFFGIKQKLFTTFHSQTKGQIER